MAPLGEKLRALAGPEHRRELPQRLWRRASWESYAAWSSVASRLHRSAWDSAARGGTAPVDVFGDADDVRWLWLNTRGLRSEPSVRAILPAIPDEATQLQFTGSSGDGTLREAWNFYRLVRDTYNAHSRSGPLGRTAAVLDYGCGWGRIIRFFLKDVHPAQLWGIDCDPDAIELCRATNRWATFLTVDPMPPTSLPDATFDLVYAYSVFSHLTEEAHDRWLDEFVRVLTPGGMLVLTTRQREFIEKCAWLRTEAAATSPSSHLVSAGAFVDTAAALAAYDGGEYTFSHRGPDDPAHFGETCIPESYVRRHWTDRFEILDYLDDHRYCEQNVVVARKE